MGIAGAGPAPVEEEGSASLAPDTEGGGRVVPAFLPLPEEDTGGGKGIGEEEGPEAFGTEASGWRMVESEGRG